MPELELTAGTIDYDDTGGDGPVLVLLGGVTMDGPVWEPMVADLRRDHRCVVPTLPLGGASPADAARRGPVALGLRPDTCSAWSQYAALIPQENRRGSENPG